MNRPVELRNRPRCLFPKPQRRILVTHRLRRRSGTALVLTERQYRR